MARLLVAFVMAMVVLVGLYLVLRPGPRAAEPRERAFEVFVEGGGMVPGELRVGEGDLVTLNVEAGEPVDLHLHGYGIEVAAGPGDGGVVAFGARLAGRFGIEDHRSEREVGVLVVDPR